MIFCDQLLAQGKVGMDTKKITVAVLPMNGIVLNTSGDSSVLFRDKASVEAFAESATQKIVSALVNTKRVRVIERGALDEILKEQDFQLGDFSKTDASVKIGELAGAEYILQGHLQQVSVSPVTETDINGQPTVDPAFTSTVEFNLRLINVSTGEITASKGFKGSLGFLTRKTPSEAANAALDQGVKTAGESLKLAFPAEGYILEIKKAKKGEAKIVTITCGKDLGVRKDDVFRVFIETEVDLDGRKVKRSSDVGKLVVAKLEQDGIFTTCEVEKGGKQISEKFFSGAKLKVVQVKK
jgi:curli biogenesis system outer membrane secretion channel CsgG